MEHVIRIGMCSSTYWWNNIDTYIRRVIDIIQHTCIRIVACVYWHHTTYVYTFRRMRMLAPHDIRVYVSSYAYAGTTRHTCIRIVPCVCWHHTTYVNTFRRMCILAPNDIRVRLGEFLENWVCVCHFSYLNGTCQHKEQVPPRYQEHNHLVI